MKPKKRPMMSARDRLYQQPLDHVQEFCFDQKVVDVFDDMIQRSVPGYAMTLQMLAVAVQQLSLKQPAVGYDLGSSLGACTAIMAQNASCLKHVIGIDSSSDMIESAQKRLQNIKLTTSWQFICQDIRSVSFDNAGLVVLNFILQFMPLAERQELLKKIYQFTVPGGFIFLSEKIKDADLSDDEFWINWHHQFKAINGYSDLEISQKRTALENILRPESLETHTRRLQQAGYRHVKVLMRCLNFVNILAIK